jgi:putative ABC transport system permease protein
MWIKDLLHSARGLKNSPLFALAAVVTIALGIGASTAIFSVVNAVLLQPLPYRDPGTLVLVASDMRVRHVSDFPLSPPDYDDLRRGAAAFQDFAAVNTGQVVVSGDNAEPEQVRIAGITPNFFRMLGGRIEAGRDFTDADATPPPAAQPQSGPAAQPVPPPAIAVVSNEFWKRRYGADPNLIGRSIDMGNGKALIVGVLDPGFELLFAPRLGLERLPDLWTAMRIDYRNSSRNDVFLQAVGRLKPGVSVQTAQSQVDRVAADLRRQFPIKQTAGLYFRVAPMQEDLVKDVRPAILALMGAVIFLLLIACANVGNLQLVRAASRGRELAVRAALGGNRWDLVRQMLAESLLLAAAGALLGLGLARLGIDLLISLGPRNLPRLDSVAIDTRVLAFAALAGLVSAVAFGIMPALRASRPDIADVLRASGRTSGLSGSQFLRNAVVTAEVALSFVLLIGSGLMVRSFVELTRVDPGFDPQGILTFRLPVTTARGVQQRAAFMNDIRERMRHLPGVKSVTAAFAMPLDGPASPVRWGKEEALADPGRYQAADVHIVLPGYFETLRTPLVEGRTFTEADNAGGGKYLIIDRMLAAKAFPHQAAVGKRLLTRIRTKDPEWFEVIGVVAHQRNESLAADGREGLYVTDGYMQFGTATRWALRTEGDPMQVAPLVRAEIAKFDKRLAVDEVMPFAGYVERAKAQTRFALVLIGVFAAIAALLAAVGLYGVLSSSVKQRTAEIGLRMALGAGPGSIFQLVVSQGLRLSAAGIGLGIIGALALTQMMSSMLVGVKPTDPVTFGGMALFFFAIASLASWMPARRAAGLDPTVALREE